MDELQQFVPNVHFEQIPIKNLVSNHLMSNERQRISTYSKLTR